MGYQAGCRVADYQVFIDDSGTKEYADDPAKYGPRGKSRYFCFGSLLIERDSGSLLADKIAEAKRRTFGSPNVEIKSNWLRNPDERKRRYLDPHDLDEDGLTTFVEEYYKIVGESGCSVVAAVVDKVHMQEDYAMPWYAPAVAYEVLMQRHAQSVVPPDRLTVTIDDMSGATPNGNSYKSNLQAHHASLRAKGSKLVKGLNFGALDHNIRFVNSAHSHLVQVADIFAYNVYRQFVDHGDAWEDGVSGKLPTYTWFKKMGKLFRTDGAGRIQGYGVAKFPMRKQVRWGYYEGKK